MRNKQELKMVDDFLNCWKDSIIVDLNDDVDDDVDDGQFLPNLVEICADIEIGEEIYSLSYQVSTTHDAGCFSSQLSINSESGSVESLDDALREFGFDEEFIDNNLFEISEMIADKLEIQKEYDDYCSDFGTFERPFNCFDANSEEFVLNDK